MRWLLCVGIVGGVAAVVASAGWTFFRGGPQRQPAAAVQVERSDGETERTAADEGAETASTGVETLQMSPKAVTDETSHRLGVLEPGQNCEHTFWIRNEGDAPLKLERGGTSCQCTMSDLPSGEVPPGLAVEVRVASKIEAKEGPFDHRATILTNDPKRPQIDFTLRGEVRTILAVDQPTVAVYTLAGEAPTLPPIVVFSLAWKEFSIVDVTASMPEATWDVKPADAEALNRLRAESGCVLSVGMPPQEETGTHTLYLDVAAHPDGQPEAKHVTHITFVHEVRGGGSISGPKFNGYNSTLDLGPLCEGEGKTDHVVAAIRDKQRRPNVVKIESEPKFLKVVAEPLEGGRPGTHMFRIEVEVPPDAPPCNYRTTKGWVRVVTDSKALKTGAFQFNVSFAISSRW